MMGLRASVMTEVELGLMIRMFEAAMVEIVVLYSVDEVENDEY